MRIAGNRGVPACYRPPASKPALPAAAEMASVPGDAQGADRADRRVEARAGGTAPGAAPDGRVIAAGRPAASGRPPQGPSGGR